MFRVDSDRALEWPVHRVVTQQARTFLQVVVVMLSHHYAAQPKLSAATGLLYQQPCKHTPNAPEPVQHDVLGLLDRRNVAADDAVAFALDELFGGHLLGLGLFHEMRSEFSHVHVAGAEVEFGERLEDGEAFEFRQLVVNDVAHEAMDTHDAGDALVVERAPVAIHHHVVAVERANHGNHGFGERFTLLPVRKVIVETR